MLDDLGVGGLQRVASPCPPSSCRTRSIHHPVHHLADVHRTLVAARFGRWDQRPDFGPLLVAQIALIPQVGCGRSRFSLLHIQFPQTKEGGTRW